MPSLSLLSRAVVPLELTRKKSVGTWQHRSSTNTDSTACYRNRKHVNKSAVNTIPSHCLVDGLTNDYLLLEIASFLSLDSIQSLTAVNRRFRCLLHSDASDFLWRSLLRSEWPFLDDTIAPLRCITKPSVPKNLNQKSQPEHSRNTSTIHAYMGSLLTLSSSKCSTVQVLPVDAHDDNNNNNDAAGPRPFELTKIRASSLPRKDEGNNNNVNENNRKDLELEAVRFVGTVGEHNRSFQADAALPRPVSVVLPNRCSKGRWSGIRRRKHGSKKELRRHFRPFVAPFRGIDNALHLTPRLVSYFEVSILDAAAGSTTATLQHGPSSTATSSTNPKPLPDCIAIGIATRDFSVDSQMPGWDATSYGYHGDDGAVFHDRQRTANTYGPTFGAGDTVGCGVDYEQGHVFFTLNGRYLGKAFDVDDTSILQEWYPVVGMDCKWLAVCNFGTNQPFVFDLAKLVQLRQASIVRALTATTSSS